MEPAFWVAVAGAVVANGLVVITGAISVTYWASGQLKKIEVELADIRGKLQLSSQALAESSARADRAEKTADRTAVSDHQERQDDRKEARLMANEARAELKKDISDGIGSIIAQLNEVLERVKRLEGKE